MVRRRFLITGGAGFIGSNLVDRLLALNPARLVVLDNFDDFYSTSVKRANIADHLRQRNYRLIETDIRNYNELKQVFADEVFDTIIHLAAKAGVRPSLADPRGYHEVNVTGTLNLLELAQRNDIKKFVFGSSSSVYGAKAVAPFREDAPLLPISPYAATKASGELLAHTYSHLYGMNITCLRFFTVYGPRQRPDLAIHKFARLIASGQPVPVFGDGSAERDFTYIDDILNGIAAAAEYDATPFEVINLGASQTVTVKQMIEGLEEALGQKATLDYQPPQPGDVPRTHADVSKARQLLNYQPTTPFAVGIRRFAEWFERGAKF
ncbi:MAG: GDP-mannose 4,6-dehydratase [Acidobacteria bacterium]|nr:GDP-mannose 4,6-dehydratase [Acidobacteriota bacterium]MBI3424411.1 GDP-mannose 4,6-dehydratase [Acidobacteriota bacterium]